MTATYPLHHESAVLLDAPAEEAFAYLDDFKALSAHMEKRSAMMMGARMRIATDELGGRAVGSRVRMEGNMLAMTLRLEEVVTQRQAPFRKTWQTVDADLLVIGPYRLGFELSPAANHSALRVFIDYGLPQAWPGRWLGRLFGALYARWCTGRMVRDAVRRFGGAPV